MPSVSHYSAVREKHKSGWVQPSLEYTSNCDPPDKPVALVLYPQAGEGTICRVPDWQHRGRDPVRKRPWVTPEWIEEQNAGRAKRSVRRFVRANRMAYMWTLTFAREVREWDAAMSAISRFFRRLRNVLGQLALIAVPEPQPKGHAWHFHLAVPTWLDWRLIRRLWGQGHVFVTGRGRGKGRWKADRLADYLSKYIAKTLTSDELPEGFVGRRRGQHRYRLTHGYKPSVIRLDFYDLGTAYTCLQMLYGDPKAHGWYRAFPGGPVENHWFRFAEVLWHPPPTRPER